MSEVEFYQKALWLMGSISSAFGVALLGLIIWNAKRFLAQQAESERVISEKLDGIQRYMQGELRAMDVRLAVIETLVLPHRPAVPIVRVSNE